MAQNQFSIAAAVLAISIPALETAWAESVQTIEKHEKTCADQTRHQEQNQAIPHQLLTAISHVESGRWHKGAGAKIAWPWTVTSGGSGRFFDTKEEALAEVEFLMTEGVRNIDVGCMQINLHYHGHAFETLAEALDPAKNTAYAAKFLKSLKKPNNSWMDAAGAYHSSTPDKKAYYQDKVAAHWSGTGGQAQTAAAPNDNPRPARVEQSAANEIDFARMNRLNEAFRKRRGNDPVAANALNKAQAQTAGRQRELRQWQDARSTGQNLTHLIAMRRAQQKLRERKRLASMGKSRFPKKRQEQLRQWREKGIWHGG